MSSPPPQLSSLEVLFATYGFHAIAHAIVKELDYLSLVYLKRSSKAFYKFFKETNLETLLKVRLEEKLSVDWRNHFQSNGQVKPVKECECGPNVVSSMIFIEEKIAAVASADRIRLFNMDSGALIGTLDHNYRCLRSTHRDSHDMPREVSCMQATSSILISGMTDGFICVFDLELLQLVHKKRHFGEPKTMKLINNFLVTGNFDDLRTGLITIWGVNETNTLTLVWHHFGDLIPVKHLDVIINRDVIFIASVEECDLWIERDDNLSLVKVKLREEPYEGDHYDEPFPFELLQENRITSLSGLSEDPYFAMQCQFLDSERLAVTEKRGCLIIMSLKEDLGFPVQRILRLQTGQFNMCHGMQCVDNKAICVDLVENFTVMLIDLDDRNEDYKREKNEYRGIGIMEEIFTENDSRLLMKHQWNRELNNGFPVATINRRQVGYMCCKKVIVHDVWTDLKGPEN